MNGEQPVPSDASPESAITRRSLLGFMAMAGALATRAASAQKPHGIRRAFDAIAFDGFPIIDPRPVSALAEHLYPGKGEQLSSLWRTRQFEYTWLRTLSGRYADFWQVTSEALEYATRALNLASSSSERDELTQCYWKLEAWPHVLPALKELKAAGVRMAFLSNFTAAMLEAVLRNSGLEAFEDHLTTDRVRAFKPDARAYDMSPVAFQCAREKILFVASASWDVAGAKWFGYPTYWLNRASMPAESLGVAADGEGNTMADLVQFVLRP